MTTVWVIIAVLVGGIVTNSPYSFDSREKCEQALAVLEASPIAPEREYSGCHAVQFPWAEGEPA